MSPIGFVKRKIFSDRSHSTATNRILDKLNLGMGPLPQLPETKIDRHAMMKLQHKFLTPKIASNQSES